MNEDRHQILDMLKQGKISVAEAEELLDATGAAPEAQTLAAKSKPKYLRVVVDDDEDHVDVRVPLQLVRSGIKLGAFIPKDARAKMSQALDEKGIDFDLSNLDPKAVEELIEGLADMSVNVQSDDSKVRVFCE